MGSYFSSKAEHGHSEQQMLLLQEQQAEIRKSSSSRGKGRGREIIGVELVRAGCYYWVSLASGRMHSIHIL